MGEYGLAFFVAAAVVVVLLLVIVALLLNMRKIIATQLSEVRPSQFTGEDAVTPGDPPASDEYLDEMELIDRMVTANNMGDELAYRRYKQLWLSSESGDEPEIPRDKEAAVADDLLLSDPETFIESSLRDMEASPPLAPSKKKKAAKAGKHNE